MKYKNYFLTMVLWLCHFIILAKPLPTLSKSQKPTWLRETTRTPQKINTDDISMGYYFELIESQYHLGLETYYNKTIKVLFDDNGIENAGQEFVTFDPVYQKLVIHEFYILREGKQLDRLNLSKFNIHATENDLSRSIYNGQFTAHNVIDDLRKGDKIVFAYSIIGFNPVFEGKFANSYYLESAEPVGLVHLNYVVPDARNILFKTHAGAKAGKKEKLAGHTQYTWEENTSVSSEYEEWLPSWFQKFAWVECSEFSTWRQVSEWAMRVNPIPDLSETSSIKKFTNNLWNEVSGNKYKFIEHCVNFVQNEIRYMGIEMGQHSHRAHLPEKVFNQRYGDCKDKSILLAAMLEDKGIETSIVLANTNQYKGLDDQLPSPFSFNHMVLMIKLDHELKMIDPTITNQSGPIEFRYFPYYGEVLLCEQGSKLTAVDKPSMNKVFEENILQLGSEGSATLIVKTRFEGGEADQMRTTIKEIGKNQLYKDYESFYSKLYNHAVRKDNLLVEDDQLNNVLKIQEFYTIKKVVHTDEQGKLMVPAFSKTLADLLPEIKEGRLSPVALTYPTDRSHIIKIVNKNNQVIGNYESAQSFNRKAYRIAQNVFNSKDTLVVQLALEFHQPYIHSEDIKEYLGDMTEKNNLFFYYYFLDANGFINIQDFTNFKLHYLSFGYFLLIVGLTCMLWIFKLQKLRPKSIDGSLALTQYSEIGGWMILYMIGLVAGTLLNAAELFGSESVLDANFIDYVYSEPNTGFVLKFFLFFTLTYFSISITSTIFIIYFFFKRRDIVPPAIILNMIFNLVAYLIMLVSLQHLKIESHNLQEIYVDIMKSLFAFIVWGTYFYQSKRVRGTFTVPYQYEIKKDEFTEKN